MTGSKRILSKINSLSEKLPSYSYFANRNPRNLERLCIAYNVDGYHLEKPGRNYWHKLQLIPSNKYITAKLIHFKNGSIVECSTNEWAIKKHLYKGNDTAAYINLARIFSLRCMEAGITEMRCDLQPKSNGKIEKFLHMLTSSGIILQEPIRIKAVQPWDMQRPDKPWEITE